MAYRLMTAIWELLWSPFDPWKEILSSDPRIGPAIMFAGDKSLDSWKPRLAWKRQAVLKNDNHIAVHLAFRTKDGQVKYHCDAIRPGDIIAPRVGPEDVEFLFVFLGNAARLADGLRKAPTRVRERAITKKEFERSFGWYVKTV